jgi:hypothetical protein
MTGILSRKASAPFSGSSNPPVGRRQLSPLEYGGMVVAGLPPGSNALVVLLIIHVLQVEQAPTEIAGVHASRLESRR